MSLNWKTSLEYATKLENKLKCQIDLHNTKLIWTQIQMQIAQINYHVNKLETNSNLNLKPTTTSLNWDKVKSKIKTPTK